MFLTVLHFLYSKFSSISISIFILTVRYFSLLENSTKHFDVINSDFVDFFVTDDSCDDKKDEGAPGPKQVTSGKQPQNTM